MDVPELRARLRRLGVREDAYSLGEGVKNEAYVLEHTGSEWLIFYAERGLRTGQRRFPSEDAACTALLRELQSMVAIEQRQPPPAQHPPSPERHHHPPGEPAAERASEASVPQGVWPWWGRALFWVVLAVVLVAAAVGALHARANSAGLRLVVSAVIVPGLAVVLVTAVRAVAARARRRGAGSRLPRSHPGHPAERVSVPDGSASATQPKPTGRTLSQQTLEELIEAVRQEQLEPPWRRSTHASDESLAGALELLRVAYYFLGVGNRRDAMGRLGQLSRLVGESWEYRSPLALDILSISPVTW